MTSTKAKINITIKPATHSDAKALTILLDGLGYAAQAEILAKRFDKFISQDGYGVMLAQMDTKIVGFIAWSKSQLFVSDAIRIHIEAIAVDAQYQGLGIGKKLIEYVEKIAKNYPHVIIDLTSGTRREKDGTHEFYKKLGYRNEGHMAKLYLRKEL